jgi:predicted alpha-1,6-mannanase (GH76 family)
MTATKPRLRWNGLLWALPNRLYDCWRYWWSWYAADCGLVDAELENRFVADRCLELLPR